MDWLMKFLGLKKDSEMPSQPIPSQPIPSQPTPSPAPPSPSPEKPKSQVNNFTPADQREIDILAKLHPYFANQVKDMLTKCRAAGLAVYIFEGERTFEKQREYYAKGRDANGNVINQKAVVTRAKPGSSYHNYGLAVDIVFDGDTIKPGIQWTWSKPQGDWAKMGAIGESCGLEWAGHWRSFQEMPHHQLKIPGIGIHELFALYANSGQNLKTVWDKINLQLGLDSLS